MPSSFYIFDMQSTGNSRSERKNAAHYGIRVKGRRKTWKISVHSCVRFEVTAVMSLLGPDLETIGVGKLDRTSTGHINYY